MNIRRDFYNKINEMAEQVKGALLSEAEPGDKVAVEKFIYLAHSAAKIELLEKKVDTIYRVVAEETEGLGGLSEEEIEEINTNSLHVLKMLGHMKRSVETQMQIIANTEISADIDRKFTEGEKNEG